MTTQQLQFIYEEIAPGIQVQQAKVEDAAEVYELIVNTAKWLNAKGSSQWSALLSGQDSHNMKEATLRGEVFAFREGDTLAAVVMLLQQPGEWDKDLWGEDGHEWMLYLHRLAVNRDYAGRGLGKAILRWALSGLRIEGKDTVRLDCLGNHELLNAFYQSAGFTYCGESSSGFSKFEQPMDI